MEVKVNSLKRESLDECSSIQALATKELTDSYQAKLLKSIAGDVEALAVDIAYKHGDAAEIQAEDGGKVFLECYGSCVLTVFCDIMAHSMLLLYSAGGMPAVRAFTEKAMQHVEYVTIEKAKKMEIEPFSVCAGKSEASSQNVA